MKTPDAGASHEENDMFGRYFAGVEEGPDIDASLIFEEAEMLRKQAAMLFDQAFSKSRAELAHCEDEFRKLELESDELRALYAKKEVELNDIRAHLERISRERADLDEQLKQKDDLVGQLREELKAKDTEILGLQQRMDEVVSEKDTLREKLTSAEHQLQGAKGEGRRYKELHAESAAELSKMKSEIDELVSSYRNDAVVANARAKKASTEAKIKLTQALDHSRLESRRQALKEVYAKGFDLSTEIEKVKALEEESATLLTSDEDSASGSESSEDEEEVLEGEETVDDQGVEGQAVKGAAPERTSSDQVTPAED